MDGSGIYLASRSAGSGDDISVGEMRLLVTAAISFDAHAIIQAILKVQKLKQALEDQFTNAKPSTSGSQFMNPSEREIVAYMEDNPDTGNPFNSPEGSSQFKQQPQSSSNVRVEPAYQIPIETQAHKDGGFNAQAVFMRDYSPPPRIAADPNRIFSDCGPTSSTMSDPLLNPSDIKSSIASLHSSGYYSMSDPLLGEGLPPIFTYPSKVKVKRKRKWQIPQKSFTRPILPAHTTEGASLKVGESSTGESPISESPKAKEKTPPIGEISNRPRLSPNTQRLVDKGENLSSEDDDLIIIEPHSLNPTKSSDEPSFLYPTNSSDEDTFLKDNSRYIKSLLHLPDRLITPSFCVQRKKCPPSADGSWKVDAARVFLIRLVEIGFGTISKGKTIRTFHFKRIYRPKVSAVAKTFLVENGLLGY